VTVNIKSKLFKKAKTYSKDFSNTENQDSPEAFIENKDTILINNIDECNFGSASFFEDPKYNKLSKRLFERVDKDMLYLNKNNNNSEYYPIIEKKNYLNGKLLYNFCFFIPNRNRSDFSF